MHTCIAYASFTCHVPSAHVPIAGLLAVHQLTVGRVRNPKDETAKRARMRHICTVRSLSIYMRSRVMIAIRAIARASVKGVRAMLAAPPGPV